MEEFLKTLIIRVIATALFSGLFTYIAYKYQGRLLNWFARILTDPRLAFQVLVVSALSVAWLLFSGSLAPIPNYLVWAYIMCTVITGFLTLLGAAGCVFCLARCLYSLFKRQDSTHEQASIPTVDPR